MGRFFDGLARRIPLAAVWCLCGAALWAQGAAAEAFGPPSLAMAGAPSVGAAEDLPEAFLWPLDALTASATLGPLPLPTIERTTGANQASALFGSMVELFQLDREAGLELVTGAPAEDIGGGNRVGRVRIFRGTAPTFTTVPWKVLDDPETPASAARGNEFGISSTAADFNGDGLVDLAIGARSADVPGTLRAGKVVVFFGPEFEKSQVILPKTPVTGALFGHWLASGDIDGDGKSDLVIGAPEGTSSGGLPKVGIVEVLYGPFDGRRSLIDCPVPVSEADFGYRVSVADGNRDGYADLAVAATTYPLGPCASAVNPCAGAGSMIDRSGRVWVFAGPDLEQVVDFANPNPSPDPAGGCYQGLLGADMVFKDADGDELPDVVVTAEWDTLNPSVYGQGSVWILYGPDYTRRLQVTASDPIVYGGFGGGADVLDFNRDGVLDLIVGEFTRAGNNGLVCQAGRASILYGPDYTTRVTFVEPAPTGAQRQFGRRARGGDIDGDGHDEGFIGAPLSSSNPTASRRNSGAVFTLIF